MKNFYDYRAMNKNEMIPLKGIVLWRKKESMFIYIFKSNHKVKNLLKGYYIIPRCVYIYNPFVLKGFWHGVLEMFKRK